MQEDLGWQLMDGSMGAYFRGDYENAVLDPESWYTLVTNPLEMAFPRFK